MTLIKDKRTGVYKARVQAVDGTTRTISTKATSREEAKRVLKQSKLSEIEEAAKAGRLSTEGITQILAGRRVTFDAAREEFLERSRNRGRSPRQVFNYDVALKQFADFSGLSGKPISLITEKAISDFINQPGSQKATTKRTLLSVIAVFCEFLGDKGWMRGNPARLVCVSMDDLSHEQKESRQRRPFTDSEVKVLLSELGSRLETCQKKMEAALAEKIQPLRLIEKLATKIEDLTFWVSAVSIARYTGLRLGDIASLEWASISKPGTIVVWMDKTNKRIELPTTPEIEAIRDSVVKLDEQYVFPSYHAIAKDPGSRHHLSMMFSRLCKSVGITDKTFHDLRSSFLSDAARRGIPIEYIAKLAGHSSILTTQGYIKPMNG